jgi:hypothetical protein
MGVEKRKNYFHQLEAYGNLMVHAIFKGHVMKTVYYVLVISIVLLFHTGLVVCGNDAKNRSVCLPSVIPDKNGVDIEDYLVMGPFPVKDGEDLNEVDYLSRVNLCENIARVEEFVEKLYNCRRTSYGMEFLSASNDYNFVDFNFTFNQREWKESGDVAYVAFNIKSDKKRVALLSVGSLGAPRVFVNGKSVRFVKKANKLNLHQELVMVHLISGNNLVIIKVPRQNTLWGVRAHLALSRDALTTVALEKQPGREKTITTKLVYGSFDESVILSPVGTSKHVGFNGHAASVAGIRTGTVANRELHWDKTHAQDGLHKVILHAGGREYYERLLVGDPAQFIKQIIRRIDALSSRSDIQDSFFTMKSRLELLANELDKAHNVNLDDNGLALSRSSQRMLIHELWNAEEALVRNGRGKSPFAHVPGLHLRGFTSDIDGTLQCYRLFVPSCYSETGEKLPLAVIMPAAISTPRPFLRSPFLRDHRLADCMSRFAEEHGVILLWSGYHNQPTGMPMEAAHLDEVLEALARDYVYNHQRVTLVAMCSGAAMALDACASWPGRFAGIALLKPEFTLDQTMPDRHVAVFSKRKGFREWFMGKHGSNAYFERKTPAMFIIHNGCNEPGHGDLKDSESFSYRAAQAKAPVIFEIHPRQGTMYLEGWGKLIQWASKQRIECDNFPSSFTRRRCDTVQDALTEKFWIVQGTAGTDGENTANADIAEAIQSEWTKTHFGACRVTRDHELTVDKLQNANLVLIGNPRTNSVWRDLEADMDLKITEDAMAWGARQWFGAALGIQAVMPNPRNSKKRMILVGGHNPTRESFGTLNLSRDGWFRYAVWSCDQDNKANLQDAGL